MLTKHVKKGASAAWIPTFEAESWGGKGLCSRGWEIIEKKGGIYLPFVPNGINFTPHAADVISGNFTGCIMAAFTDSDNIRKVCHVSTGVKQDCKVEWEKIKSESSNVVEFKPSDAIKVKKGDAFLFCYGIITTKLKLYSVTVCMRNREKIVSRVKKCKALKNKN